MTKKRTRDYESINLKMTAETKVLFEQMYSILRMKEGEKLTKSFVVRHVIAIARDYYAGETGV